MPLSAWRILELGVDLKHYMVLVQRREHGRDDTLAEGIIERVVYRKG